MAIGVLASDDRRAVSSVRRRSWYAQAFHWVLWLAVLSLLAVAIVGVAENEVRTNRAFDQAHQSLGSTKSQIAHAVSDLTGVRQQLATTDMQVGADSSALERDSAELKGAEGVLAQTRAHVLQQAETIDSLNACLAGVEKALNALSVADQTDAVSALNAVSSKCEDATGSGE